MYLHRTARGPIRPPDSPDVQTFRFDMTTATWRATVGIGFAVAFITLQFAYAQGPVNLSKDTEKQKKECEEKRGRWVVHMEQTGGVVTDRVECTPYIRRAIPKSLLPDKYCYTGANGSEECADEQWLENRFRDFKRETQGGASPERAEQWWKEVEKDEPIVSRLKQEFPQQLDWFRPEDMSGGEVTPREQIESLESMSARTVAARGNEEALQKLSAENTEERNAGRLMFFGEGLRRTLPIQGDDANGSFISLREQAFREHGATTDNAARLDELAEAWAVFYGHTSQETFGQYQERVNRARAEVESNWVTWGLAHLLLGVKNTYRYIFE